MSTPEVAPKTPLEDSPSCSVKNGPQCVDPGSDSSQMKISDDSAFNNPLPNNANMKCVTADLNGREMKNINTDMEEKRSTEELHYIAFGLWLHFQTWGLNAHKVGRTNSRGVVDATVGMNNSHTSGTSAEGGHDNGASDRGRNGETLKDLHVAVRRDPIYLVILATITEYKHLQSRMCRSLALTAQCISMKRIVSVSAVEYPNAISVRVACTALSVDSSAVVERSARGRVRTARDFQLLQTPRVTHHHHHRHPRPQQHNGNGCMAESISGNNSHDRCDVGRAGSGSSSNRHAALFDTSSRNGTHNHDDTDFNFNLNVDGTSSSRPTSTSTCIENSPLSSEYTSLPPSISRTSSKRTHKPPSDTRNTITSPLEDRNKMTSPLGYPISLTVEDSSLVMDLDPRPFDSRHPATLWGSNLSGVPTALNANAGIRGKDKEKERETGRLSGRTDVHRSELMATFADKGVGTERDERDWVIIDEAPSVQPAVTRRALLSKALSSVDLSRHNHNHAVTESKGLESPLTEVTSPISAIESVAIVSTH